MDVIKMRNPTPSPRPYFCPSHLQHTPHLQVFIKSAHLVSVLAAPNQFNFPALGLEICKKVLLGAIGDPQGSFHKGRTS